MHLVDCGTNAQVAANQKRKCSQYILVSNELQNNIDTIVTKFEQNNKDLFVGSMSVKDILSIAMIPDLDFSLGLKEFAQYTSVKRIFEATIIINKPTIQALLFQGPLSLENEMMMMISHAAPT